MNSSRQPTSGGPPAWGLGKKLTTSQSIEKQQFRMDFGYSLERYGLDSSGSGQGLVAGSCKHGNEPSWCIKSREFLDLLSDF
jgi:hypothetical protein